MLKLLHTADWHLGMRFRQFGEEAGNRLARARFDVLPEIFGLARRERVHAVLAAGDLFDEANPPTSVWEALLDVFRRAGDCPPTFLLPGNHDPLLVSSVWAASHPFRRQLPPWVHVIDKPLVEAPLADGAVLLAVPCQSAASLDDPALALPNRAPSDARVRIGMVHGMTFDFDGARTNFPIAGDAAARRGLDYLALGDTHGFRVFGENPPTVYPGAPEPTKFGETGAGSVAMVLVRRNRRVTVDPISVGRWRFREETASTPEALEALLSERLDSTALKLKVCGRHPPETHARMKAALDRLSSAALPGPRVGALKLDASEFRLDPRDIEQMFAALPPELAEAARRLRARAETPGPPGPSGLPGPPGPPGQERVAELALQKLIALARELSSAELR